MSTEHIQLLQQQLELAKSEAARHAQEAAAAKAKEAATDEAAREMAAKASERMAALTEATAELSALKAQQADAAAREAALQKENEQLLQRLMDAMSLQAQVMDSEVQRHEERRLTLESGKAAEIAAELFGQAGGASGAGGADAVAAQVEGSKRHERRYDVHPAPLRWQQRQRQLAAATGF